MKRGLVKVVAAMVFLCMVGGLAVLATPTPVLVSMIQHLSHTAA